MEKETKKGNQKKDDVTIIKMTESELKKSCPELYNWAIKTNGGK